MLFTIGLASPLAIRSGEHESAPHRAYGRIWEWTRYRQKTPQKIEHTMHRAGHPNQVSRRAALPKPGSIQGYPVGGGEPFGHGFAPSPADGTWGWDATGTNLLPRSFRLGYGYGRKRQGGTGAYATDRESR